MEKVQKGTLVCRVRIYEVEHILCGYATTKQLSVKKVYFLVRCMGNSTYQMWSQHSLHTSLVRLVLDTFNNVSVLRTQYFI
jgi:hypothetical protein